MAERGASPGRKHWLVRRSPALFQPCAQFAHALGGEGDDALFAALAVHAEVGTGAELDVCAVQPDAWRATVSAMALMGVVGEVAAEKAVVRRQGVGSMQVALLDELQLLDQATFEQRLKMEFKPW